MKIWALAAGLAVVVAACGDTTTPTAPASTSAAGATTTTEAAAAATTVPVTTTATTPPTTAPPTTAPPTTIDPDAPVVVAIEYRDGEVSGPGRVEVAKGDSVELVVTADIADEVHVHGYDLFMDVAAGETISIAFEATIQGIFEVELEGVRTPLLELVVS